MPLFYSANDGVVGLPDGFQIAHQSKSKSPHSKIEVYAQRQEQSRDYI